VQDLYQGKSDAEGETLEQLQARTAYAFLAMKSARSKCNDTVVDFVAANHKKCKLTGDMARSRGSSAIAVLSNELSKLRLVLSDLT
jgi:hypothetical protein